MSLLIYFVENRWHIKFISGHFTGRRMLIKLRGTKLENGLEIVVRKYQLRNLDSNLEKGTLGQKGQMMPTLAKPSRSRTAGLIPAAEEETHGHQRESARDPPDRKRAASQNIDFSRTLID